MKRFFTALSFLTTVPSPIHAPPQIDELGKSAAWFPLVGALLGGSIALIQVGLAKILPLPVSAVLSTGAWVFLTGGLHLDGLADSFDGLFNSSLPGRRLEIMKDPRLGTFGGLGLILMIVLKISLLATLPINFIWFAIPLAASTARWLLIWAARQPMARPDGMGAAFKPELNRWGMLLTSLIPLGLAALSGWRGIAALIFGCICAAGIFRWARVRLGGSTGDVFGLLVETVEAVTLLVFVVHI
jgi:adenosylcobinamide-GDP ribazoletransferase